MSGLERITEALSAVKSATWDAADMMLLKGYTRAALGWEGKRRSLRSLVLPLSISGAALPLFSQDYVAGFAFIAGSDMMMSLAYSPEEYQAADKREGQYFHFLRSLFSAARLPLFLGGSGLALKEAIYDTMAHSEFSPDTSLTLLGMGMLCTASSVYLKSRDPTILEERHDYRSAFPQL